MDVAGRNGFRVATNREELLALEADGQKTIAYQRDANGSTSMCYGIDRPADHASLADFTRKGIELLDGPDGFFMMVEGGRIDGACHVHDVVSAVVDVIALDRAVAEAYAFLQRHPGETLIVVTADHETGGLTFLSGRSCTVLYDRMRLQSVSQGRFLGELSELGDPLPDFAGTMAVVKRCFGLMADDDPEVEVLKQKAEAGDQEAKVRLGLVLRPSEVETLRRAWEMSLLDRETRKADPEISALYTSYTPIGVECTHILNQKAGMRWLTYGHTGTPVPVTAVGAGQAMFAGFCDNTDVARGLMAVIGARPARIEALEGALSR